ncbi:MAG TPA: cysteine desulfurase NifS [Spirochaetia bacterium]|nr:cysteine desulfurase NifS [Spirochaetia bacterium]
MSAIYLDHAATTPVDPEVVKAMTPYFTEIFGNPSSLHAFGQNAKRAVEEARSEIASFLEAAPEEIIFTGGGTESDNLALKGAAFAMADKGNHIITTEIEHHAVLEPCRFLERNGFQVTYLKTNAMGLVDPGDVQRAITDRTILISVMHANNEIGTIQPVEEIGWIARQRGICFHTDAVQTFGHIPISVHTMNADLLSASAHKLYGPKGAGILYIREGTRILPLILGGDQERRLRASTHNVPGIVGMAKAVCIAKDAMKIENVTLNSMRNLFIKGLIKGVEHIRINGHAVKRLPNNINVSIRDVPAETMIMALDMAGIHCSSGSACNSLNTEPSHVLKAIGVPRDFIYGSLRFSLGRSSTENEIQRVLQVLPDLVNNLRAQLSVPARN